MELAALSEWQRFLRGLSPDSPLALWLANPSGELLRDQIQSWLQMMDRQTQRRKLSGFLGGSDIQRFCLFYNELAVGGLLKNSGYRVVYEPEIRGKTPDWLIEDDSGPLGIIEVACLEANERIARRESATLDLKRRLQAGPISQLWLTIGDFGQAEDSTPEQREQIADGVHTWIREVRPNLVDPTIRRNFQMGKCRFEVQVAPNPEGCPGHVFLPVHISNADNEDVGRVLNRIRQKAERYAPVLTDENLPLVVAIVPSFDVQIMAPIFGAIALSDGTFFGSVNAALSGILYCGYEAAFQWSFKEYWENPHSLRPLEGEFPTIRQEPGPGNTMEHG